MAPRIRKTPLNVPLVWMGSEHSIPIIAHLVVETILGTHIQHGVCHSGAESGSRYPLPAAGSLCGPIEKASKRKIPGSNPGTQAWIILEFIPPPQYVHITGTRYSSFSSRMIDPDGQHIYCPRTERYFHFPQIHYYPYLLWCFGLHECRPGTVRYSTNSWK